LFPQPKNHVSILFYSLKLLFVYQHRPPLDIVDIVPTKELKFVKVQWVLDGIHVVIVQNIASMIVGQDSLTTRAILQGLAYARYDLRKIMTYHVIMATIDDVSTTVLEVHTITIDERSRS
jgi:hypothetical protein